MFIYTVYTPFTFTQLVQLMIPVQLIHRSHSAVYDLPFHIYNPYSKPILLHRQINKSPVIPSAKYVGLPAAMYTSRYKHTGTV